MTATDLVYYNAVGTDGGAIDQASPITSGQLNNLFPNVNALDAESGAVIYRKFFIKNTHGTDTALALNVAMTRFSDADDYMALAVGTPTDTTADFTLSKFYGVSLATAELDRPSKTVNVSVEGGQTLSNLYADGDTINFLDAITGQKIAKATIDTGGVGASSLTIVEDIPAPVVLDGSYVANSIVGGDLSAGSSIAVWVRQTIPAYCGAYTNSYFGANSIFASS